MVGDFTMSSAIRFVNVHSQLRVSVKKQKKRQAHDRTLYLLAQRVVHL